MEQIQKFANGVKIEDWFYRSDGLWLHYHPSPIYSLVKKWKEVTFNKCLACNEEIPEEIKMHGMLQSLGAEGDKTNHTYWPVETGTEADSSGLH